MQDFQHQVHQQHGQAGQVEGSKACGLGMVEISATAVSNDVVSAQQTPIAQVLQHCWPAWSVTQLEFDAEQAAATMLYSAMLQEPVLLKRKGLAKTI